MQIHKLFNELEKIGIKSIEISVKDLEKLSVKFLELPEEDSPPQPLTLNEEGWFLLKDSGFEDIFETCKDQLVERVRVKWNPETKYDVQDRAQEFMFYHASDDKSPFLVLKTYAYNNGKDYAKILKAGGILLRDYYLEKHPEIKE